jgi:hypothetical protein
MKSFVSLVLPVDRLHTIEVRARDAAGNVGLLPHRIVTVQN